MDLNHGLKLMITIRNQASTLHSYLIDSASWFRFECHSLTDNIALVTYISRLHRDIFYIPGCIAFGNNNVILR